MSSIVLLLLLLLIRHDMEFIWWKTAFSCFSSVFTKWFFSFNFLRIVNGKANVALTVVFYDQPPPQALTPMHGPACLSSQTPIHPSHTDIIGLHYTATTCYFKLVYLPEIQFQSISYISNLARDVDLWPFYVIGA